MFPITITLHNAAQLAIVQAALGSAPSDTDKTVAAMVETDIANRRAAAETKTEKDAAAPAPKPKTTTAKTAKPADTQPTAEAAVADAPASTTTEESSTTQHVGASDAAQSDEPASYQDAAAAVTKLSRERGRDAAISLLKEFGAEKLPNVAPEQFRALINRVSEILA